MIMVKKIEMLLKRKDKTSWWVFLLIFLSGLAFSASAQNIEKDKKLGAENALMVKSQIGLYADQEMTEYVASVGNKLVANLADNPFEFQFHIADDPVPNAFALPGGYVYVTRGFLSLIITEDELACVLGHEIIHVVQRHSIKRMRSSVLPSLLEVPGNIVGNVVSDDLGNLINAPISTSNNLLLSSYSRSHETESDVKGIALAAKSGYDPSSMSDILSRLTTAVEDMTNQQEKKSYFDDHPYTPDRVNKINKEASKLLINSAKPISTRPLEIFKGMTYGENPAKGVFVANTFLQPKLDFSIVFPEGWHTTNQSTTVGAIHANRQAAIFLGLDNAKITPAQHALRFEQEFKQKNAKVPYRSEPYSINGNSGHVFSLVDNSGSEPMYIYYLWLEMNNKVFKLIGIAPKIFEKDLDRTAESLRSISKTERKSISENYLSLVSAQNSETITALNNRTKNLLSNSFTAIINGVAENEQLKPDQQIKIVLTKKYLIR